MLLVNALCTGLVTAHIEIVQLLVLLLRKKKKKTSGKNFREEKKTRKETTSFLTDNVAIA